MKYSLKPIVNDNVKILILGSLPGEVSLQQNQYYAHPRNFFWKIMYEILGETYCDDYSTRCNMLLNHNIALWDVVGSAERKGSLDSDIKNAIPNDILGFLQSFEQVDKILLNGGKAASLFKKHFRNVSDMAIALPSTSPANASMTYAKKLELWKQAIRL